MHKLLDIARVMVTRAGNKIGLLLLFSNSVRVEPVERSCATSEAKSYFRKGAKAQRRKGSKDIFCRK